jgi:hypothetical protein
MLHLYFCGFRCGVSQPPPLIIALDKLFLLAFLSFDPDGTVGSTSNCRVASVDPVGFHAEAGEVGKAGGCNGGSKFPVEGCLRWGGPNCR